MADYYAPRNEPSLSLPIRMEKKRKRTRFGTIALIAGVAMLGGTAYNLTRSGTEVIAIYLGILGIALLAIGITQFTKASKIG